MPSVVVCEAAQAPSPGAVSLLFPVADADIDGADPVRLAAMPRPLPLVYIGNQCAVPSVGFLWGPAAAPRTCGVSMGLAEGRDLAGRIEVVAPGTPASGCWRSLCELLSVTGAAHPSRGLRASLPTRRARAVAHGVVTGAQIHPFSVTAGGTRDASPCIGGLGGLGWVHRGR
jgi:hypothetical protein